MSAGRDKRPVRLVVTVAELRGCGAALEGGLQLGKDELDLGAPVDDKAVRFETELSVGTRPDGSLLYSGPAVNGPSRERFVYLSYRPPGAGGDWSRRCKIPLPQGIGADTAELSATVVDTGTTWARFDGWREA